MDSKLENKLWWFIYNTIGVHPDEYDIDFTSRDSVLKSLEDEDLGSHPEILHLTDKPDESFHVFCMKAAQNSILVDKTFAYRCAWKSLKVKLLWEECNPADAPEVDNEILMEAERGGAIIHV